MLTNLISVDALDALLQRYSSLPKILRIIAYCLRFIGNLRANPTSHTSIAVTEEQLHQALLVLIKRVQHEIFATQISNLMNNLPLTKPFRKLNPFLEAGLVRVGRRLIHSTLDYDHKHPILLPCKHRLTDLVIEDAHRKHVHPGLQTLHFLLAQNFWILSPRRAIRHVISKCLKCFRIRPVSVEPLMGNLPRPRVTQLKPFQCVGVDYGGPFFITLGRHRGAKSQKAYLCLFVCFSTKAVHLELASDLSTGAFLAALRRFIARRGRCSHILIVTPLLKCWG